MRITIPLDLSTLSFIPLPRFIHTGITTPLLTPVVLFPQSSAEAAHDVRLMYSHVLVTFLLRVVYYETITRDLKGRPIHERRCDERPPVIVFMTIEYKNTNKYVTFVFDTRIFFL